MSVRNEWQDWPAKSGLPDKDVAEGIWWIAMAYAIGLLIFRLLQVAGLEIGV